jgi:alanine racemase
VCMDVIVVDVTDVGGVEAGSIATVIGGPLDGPTGLATVARRCGTITYEILTGLTRRLPRRYIGEDGRVLGESQ